MKSFKLGAIVYKSKTAAIRNLLLHSNLKDVDIARRVGAKPPHVHIVKMAMLQEAMIEATPETVDTHAAQVVA